MMSQITNIGLTFTHSVGKIGRAVQWVTTPLCKVFNKKAREECATHVLVWFQSDDGEKFYYEAYEGEGFRGPLPYVKVEQWVTEKDGRWLKEYDLTKFLALGPEQLSSREKFCEDMLSYWTYNIPQLLLQLRIMGVGRRLFPSSPRKVICSEAAARICHSDTLDFREWCNKKNHDDISPRVLHDAVKRLVEEK